MGVNSLHFWSAKNLKDFSPGEGDFLDCSEHSHGGGGGGLGGGPGLGYESARVSLLQHSGGGGGLKFHHKAFKF